MTKTSPNLDVNRLLQSLKDPALREQKWLREQLSSKELQEGLWMLGHTVFPELLCCACTATLPHYVHLKAIGKNAEAEYPQVQAHLDLCPRCAGEYEDLYRMVSTAYADEVPIASSYPLFDLSFLQGKDRRSDSALPRADDAPAPDWPELWQDAASVGVKIHRFVTEIALSLADPFAQLAVPLRPALITVPVPLQRKWEWDIEEIQTITVLDLKYPPANLLVRIGRGPVAAQKTTLVIDVLQTEPPEPIPATRVALYDGQHRLMEQIGTDTAGSVRFEDVGIGRYFIQVRHAEETWEFPLQISAPTDDPSTLSVA